MSRNRIRRTNAKGYVEVLDEHGRWVPLHRIVAAAKLGRSLHAGEVVHHINEIKTDNRKDNLVVLDPRVHRQVHRSGGEACFRCGRVSHWVNDCYAQTFFDGWTIDREAEW